MSQNQVKQEHRGGKLEQKLVQSPPSPSVWLEQYIGGGGSNMRDEWGSQIGPDDERPLPESQGLGNFSEDTTDAELKILLEFLL